MKVVYKKSIIYKLLGKIVEARLNGKEIEKFVLTKAEAYDLQRSCPLLHLLQLEQNLRRCAY